MVGKLSPISLLIRRADLPWEPLFVEVNPDQSDDLFRSVTNCVRSLCPRISELRSPMLEERAPANVHCGEISSISCLDDELVDVTVHR